MHPFLDVSKLTDEEIIERLGKAYSYLAVQTELGHVPTVQSIKEIIESLEGERTNRLTKNADAEFSKKYPDILKPIEIGKIEE